MDNAQKAIMIGVGLFITIIIISVVLLITNLGTGIANESTETLTGLTTSMRQQLALDYHGKTVTLNQVIDCASRYGNMKDIMVQVKVSGTTHQVKNAQEAMDKASSKSTWKGTVSFGAATDDTTTAVITFE